MAMIEEAEASAADHMWRCVEECNKDIQLKLFGPPAPEAEVAMRERHAAKHPEESYATPELAHEPGYLQIQHPVPKGAVDEFLKDNARADKPQGVFDKTSNPTIVELKDAPPMKGGRFDPMLVFLPTARMTALFCRQSPSSLNEIAISKWCEWICDWLPKMPKENRRSLVLDMVAMALDTLEEQGR